MLTYDKLFVGMKIKADDGFTCIAPGAILIVDCCGNPNTDFFVRCEEGIHSLNGQVDDWETQTVIGFEVVE